MIEFINGGLLTTIQDNGRNKFQRYGVTVSGAMDKYAFKLANMLVGNDIRTALLEFTAFGPTIKFVDDDIFAVSGGIFDMTLNGRKIRNNKAYLAKAGSILKIGAVKKGLRGYIAFAGGLYADEIMHSKSTYLKGAIGGIEGRACKAGDKISFENPRSDIKNLKYRYVSFENPYLENIGKCSKVRVLLGPQDDYFTQKGIDTFLSSVYTVTKENDRMGYRLEGPEIEYKKGQNGNIITDGVPLGAIQVPNGKPIVLMTDRQTTGGYTKIASVISADLPIIAQMKEGDTLMFEKTDIYTAQKLYLEQNAYFAKLKEHFEKEEILSKNTYSVKLGGKSLSVDISEIK